MRILAFSLFLFGCETAMVEPDRLGLIPEQTYQDLVTKQTKSEKLYSGFINLIDASATFLSMDLQRAQVDHLARIYQFNEAQVNGERQKLAESFKNTTYFLSFYVPEKKWDDLSKVQTKWKIYLDVGGRRFEGTAKRVKGVLADLQASYPNLTRWHTPYQVEFPVPLTETNDAEKKLTITGSVGAVVFAHP